MTSRITGSKRVQSVAPSATKEMAILAAKVGGCVSLGQGVPSFATPQHIIDSVVRIIQDNPASGQYSLQTGMPELRKSIADYLLREQQVNVDPETEVGVTVGGMEALLATVLAVVDEGDEIILPTPTYASYIEQVNLAGGIPVYTQLNDSWGLDLEKIRLAITSKTKAIMLCNPGNPTGAVFSDEQVFALCQMAVANNFVVIVDQAYDYIIYDGETPINPLSKPEFHDHVISIHSLSKKYILTGWRIGWVTATKQWMEQIMKVHDATTICAPTPSQFAALAALEGDQSPVSSMREQLKERKELCCQRLDALSDYFSYVPPQGAFYVLAKYLFSDSPAQDIAIRMLQEAGVITIPGSSYGPGGEGHLRISFGAEPAVINEAFDRIEKWVREMK